MKLAVAVWIASMLLASGLFVLALKIVHRLFVRPAVNKEMAPLTFEVVRETTVRLGGGKTVNRIDASVRVKCFKQSDKPIGVKAIHASLHRVRNRRVETIFPQEHAFVPFNPHLLDMNKWIIDEPIANYWFGFWFELPTKDAVHLSGNYFLRITLDVVGQESQTVDFHVDDWNAARREGSTITTRRPDEIYSQASDLTERDSDFKVILEVDTEGRRAIEILQNPCTRIHLVPIPGEKQDWNGQMLSADFWFRLDNRSETTKVRIDGVKVFVVIGISRRLIQDGDIVDEGFRTVQFSDTDYSIIEPLKRSPYYKLSFNYVLTSDEIEQANQSNLMVRLVLDAANQPNYCVDLAVVDWEEIETSSGSAATVLRKGSCL